MEQWITIRNWTGPTGFQHYDPRKRAPKWIKVYTELLHDDAYLRLTGHQRAVLHGLWLEYASSRCQLALDTASISSRLRLRVTMQTLIALNHAGYIGFVASKSLADGYQSACPEVEVEKKKTLGVSDTRNGARANTEQHGPGFDEGTEEHPDPQRARELVSKVSAHFDDIPF